jgi:predicted HAD superfamily phosphohydrolase YqeG
MKEVIMSRRIMTPEDKRIAERLDEILKKQPLDGKQIQLLSDGIRALTLDVDKAIVATSQRIRRKGGEQLAGFFQELAHAQLGR